MSDPIPRLNAALEGRYRIERELGEGGMATVYLADDLRHERKVALKVLKPELAAVVGAERFLAEIKTTANLQHPHILPLFDSGEADGFLFYVMPYVEGETLRERIDRERQLPVDEALGIATAVAGALQTAHEQGVVHRDIKPGNILLSRGQPLVADFGIAIAVSAGGGGRLTETGLSLGTPYYMSPEQATGDQHVGPASDTFALACVLYEMLTGEPPYPGTTAQAVLGRIIQGAPVSATSVRRSVPANVDAAIRKALEKLPADRFANTQDFARALADPAFRHGQSPAGIGGAPGLWNRLSIATTAVAAASLAVAAWALTQPRATPGVGVATRSAGIGMGVGDFAISRDGRLFAKIDNTSAGEQAIFVRSAEDPEWRPLPNTEGAFAPSFSPDGQWIAFRLRSELTKARVDGGVHLPLGVGGGQPHWALPDTIVYVTASGAIYRIRASGEDPTLLFESDSIVARQPFVLPNGQAVVFSTQVGTDPSASRILLLDLESGLVRELAGPGVRPRYVPTGHLVYAQVDGALMAVPFDLERLEVTGTPVTVLPQVVLYNFSARFDVSETGTLVYDGGGSDARGRVLVEVTAEGEERALPIAYPRLHEPRYAPDGRRIVYTDGSDIRVYDLVTGSNRSLLDGFEPKWSNSGEYVYASRPEEGMMRRTADGSTEVERLTVGPPARYVTDAAPGDSLFIVRELTEERGWDLRIMRHTEDGPAFEDFLTADWNEVSADISPDGRWVAYQSDEGGQFRIVVRSFPDIGPAHVVSPDGGIDPLWSPDGRTLYYSFGPRFMAADVDTRAGFSASGPRLLFENSSYITLDPAFDNNWHIHPDGDRFLLVKSLIDGDAASSTYLVTNWFAELRERMGERDGP